LIDRELPSIAIELWVLSASPHATDDASRQRLQAQITSYETRYEDLKSRLDLLPLPVSDDSASIRTAASNAYDDVGQIDQIMLEVEVNLRSGTSIASKDRLDRVHNVYDDFVKEWGIAHDTMVSTLNAHQIGLSDLQLPTPVPPTPAPVMPPNTALTLKSHVDGNLFRGTITNTAGGWRAEQLTVVISVTDANGKEVAQDPAILDGNDHLGPGDNTSWHYAIPPRYQGEGFHFVDSAAWKWSAAGP
jgi:hypothetical protein